MTDLRLVLASASPRRQQLLKTLGVRFETRPADVDESPRPGEQPKHTVERVARAKAGAVGREGEVIIAADTLVALDGEPFGKPSDAADAASMLRRLAGRTHEVHSGVAVRVLLAGETTAASIIVTTEVTLTDISDEDIDWYVGTGEPLDKAGAYAVQGAGGLFVASVTGSVTNVIGLPLAETAGLLRRSHIDLLDWAG